MRVLALTRYARNGASSRLRFLQFVPELEAQGVEVVVLPFFDEQYLERLYRNESTVLRLPRYYAGRVAALIRSRRFDVVWLEKEALPWIPAGLELALLGHGIPLVVDYDDAVFHRYDQHSRRSIRTLLGGKIDQVMRAADIVVAGNDYLAQRALDAGARQVEIVPTVVDTGIYHPRESDSDSSRPVVGWIGTPATWQEYMVPRMELLKSICREQNARLRIIGAGEKASVVGGVEFRAWSEAGEVEELQKMDIGIMPLNDSPWARGKCGYKLIQYMACGVPVVASPIGVNKLIIDGRVNGFFADSDQEWKQQLETLIKNTDIRREMGCAGRKKIKADYSLGIWAPRIARILRIAAAA